MYSYKLRKWQYECRIDELKKEKQKKIKAALALLISGGNEIFKKKDYAKKRYWQYPIYSLRSHHGFYEAIFPTLAVNDDEKFLAYIRMTKSQFNELLAKVQPLISKQVVVRMPIQAAARLLIILRVLSTGDSFNTMSFKYLVGQTTVSNIVAETCEALWEALYKEMLPYPLNEADWMKIADDFENQWNFPHCIGAIDGKHVLIQCPDNAGSTYYNDKGTHSIVLMGICDANYCFTFVDIGAYGRRSDGGIFKASSMGRNFHDNQMNVPKPEKLTVDGKPLPYVLVADEAFELSNYLLRPYPGRGGLTLNKNIYNYRLSRARRVIENAFGILVARWRILKRPIDPSVEHIITMVQAIVCLHNWLRKHELGTYVTSGLVDEDAPSGFTAGQATAELADSNLCDQPCRGNNNSTRKAIEIRQQFCKYFVEEGAVPWQYRREYQ